MRSEEYAGDPFGHFYGGCDTLSERGFTVYALSDLRGTDLGATSLHGADLSWSVLAKANLGYADLSDANLHNALLADSELGSADLTNADLTDANLAGANLYSADLSGIDLRGANLRYAHLLEIKGINEEQLEQQAKSLDYAIMPDGTIYHGRYASKVFEPTLSFSVGDGEASPGGEGWSVAQELPNELFAYSSIAERQLIFTNPSDVFEPSKPNELKKVPAPEKAREWVSWLQRHPDLDTSKPVSVSVGGASGMRIDVMASSTPQNYPKDLCSQPCVPLYPLSDGSGISSSEGYKDRFVIVDVGGQTVLIDVAARADKFDEFLPKAQKVLDSVKWIGR